MDFNIYSALKIGSFIVVSSLFLKKTWEVHCERKNIKVLESRQTKINDVRQIYRLQEGSEGFFKVQIKQSQSQSQSHPLRYNQYYCCQPSQLPVIQQASKNFENSHERFYKISDGKGSLIKIKGFGKLIGDVYEVTPSHELEKIGILKRLYGGICWLLESLLHYNLVKRKYIYKPEQQTRKPLIMGPVIGSLNYLISLVTDSYVIIQCKLEKGILIGQIIAQSKGQLIHHYENKIHSEYFKLSMLFLGTILLGRMALKDLRRRLNFTYIKKGLDNIDGKECIICYSEVRNTILFDCRHMIMCYSCYQNYREQVCPICKGEIEQFKVVYQKGKQ